MKRLLNHFLSALGILALVSALAALAVAGTVRMQDGLWRLPRQADVQGLVVETLVRREAKPSKVVYLHREALDVRGGADDASANESSLVAAGTLHRVPRYRTSNATWKRLVSCVDDKFSDYDIVVTDKRPSGDDYVLVKVGGAPADIGKLGAKLGGVAPFNGRAIPNSIVFVFDQRGRFRTKNNCETAAHEIGHVFGLDHTYRCGDLMSYKQGCGKKSFVDESMACGEHQTRACEDKRERQNSGQRLVALLGTRD